MAVSTTVYYGLNYLLSCRPLSGEKTYAALAAAWSDLLAQAHAGALGAFLSTGHWTLVYPWKAAPFGWAMLAGFSALIAASLLTRPEEPTRIEAFFDRLQRSSDPEAMAAAGEKPPARDRGQDLIFLDLSGWCTAQRRQGFFARYREDLVGFVLAWGTVGALILLAWGVMQIGK